MQNFYEKYKDIRNKSWQISIDYNVNSLPINIYKLLKKMDILFYSYTEGYEIIKKNNLIQRTINNDGFSIILNNKYIIFYNDIINNSKRINFTLAHELGHIVLGHLETDNLACRNRTTLWNQVENEPLNPLEAEANIFASRLLAPAGILSMLNITTSNEISLLCNLSYSASKIRSERMKELYKRNKFGSHPLERILMQQFQPFVSNLKHLIEIGAISLK